MHNRAGTIPKSIKGRALQTGDPADECFIETVIDEFFLLFRFQPFPKFSHSFVVPEPEYVDELVEVGTRQAIGRQRGLQARFSITEHGSIGLPVLERILTVRFGKTVTSFIRLYLPFTGMLREILKCLGSSNRCHRKFHGRLVIIIEDQGIRLIHKDLVAPHTVCYRKHPAGADHPHVFHIIDLADIEHRTADTELAPGLSVQEERYNKKKKSVQQPFLGVILQ